MISAADLPNMNVVLIVGIIIFAIIQARIFVIVRRYKEVDLTSTQFTLKNSQEDLRAQQEAMEAFGIAVTHDLKAPISLAHFNLNLINRHLKNKYEGDDDLNEFVQSVHVSVSQMEKLILAYLSFNRVKNLAIDREVVNICEELDHILKSSLNRSGTEEVVCSRKNMRITTNRYLFTTIMQNMIENGLKHNVSEQPRVVIDIDEKPGQISISIKDNGIGIDPKFSKYLFKPFKRFNTKVDGSGLGLAVAKRASEKLNGHLYCKETGRDGTVFVLDLAV
jgi:signal transduction histidine kinase